VSVSGREKPRGESAREAGEFVKTKTKKHYRRARKDAARSMKSEVRPSGTETDRCDSQYVLGKKSKRTKRPG